MCGVMVRPMSASRRARLRSAVASGLLAVVGASGASAVVTAAPEPSRAVELRSVPVTHRSGGELAYLAERGLVATADRYAAGDLAALRASVSVVDARRWAQVHAVDLSRLPWVTAGGFAVPQVPSGLDAHPGSGRIVTTNSAAGTITTTHVSAVAAQAEGVVAVGAHPFGVEIDQRGRLAYVASYLEHRIDIVDLGVRRVVATIDGLRHPTKLALDEARGRLYVGNADRPPSAAHGIAVVDLPARRVVATVPVDANSRPAVDPRTGTVYAASFATGRVAVIHPSDLTAPRHVIDTGSTPHGVGVDHRRGLLYAPNLLANTVSVIDIERREVVATVPVEGVPLGVDLDHARGWAWISLRDRSALVALRLGRPAAARAAGTSKAT